MKAKVILLEKMDRENYLKSLFKNKFKQILKIIEKAAKRVSVKESAIEKSKLKQLSLNDKRKLLKETYKKVLTQMGQASNISTFMQIIDTVPEDYIDYELQINLEQAGEFVKELKSGEGTFTDEEMKNIVNIVAGVGVPALEKHATGEEKLDKESAKFGADAINKNSKEFLDSLKERRSKKALPTPERMELSAPESRELARPETGLTVNSLARLFTPNLRTNPKLQNLASKITGAGINKERIAKSLAAVVRNAKTYEEAKNIAAEKNLGVEFSKNDFEELSKIKKKEEARLNR